MFGNFVKAIRLWKPFQMRGKLNACWKWHQPPVPQNGAIEADACSPARICFCRAPSIQETSRLSPKYTGRAQRYHQEKYREREVQTHFRPVLATWHICSNMPYRFLSDTIVVCNVAERFFLHKHTFQHSRPFGRGDPICRVSWPGPAMVYQRRIASLSLFIFSEKVLELLIQLSGWGKEEGENW
jgi:hypothetical protein